MAITEAEEKRWGVRKNVKYDDDFIRSTCIFNLQFLLYDEAPYGYGTGRQGRGFTGGA
jgi:hypothetical protein